MQCIYKEIISCLKKNPQQYSIFYDFKRNNITKKNIIQQGKQLKYKTCNSRQANILKSDLENKKLTHWKKHGK